MKFFLLFLTLCSLLLGDDIERLKGILDDISKLEMNYTKCQNELKERGSDIFSADVLDIEKLKINFPNQEEVLKNFQEIFSKKDELAQELEQKVKLLSEKIITVLQEKEGITEDITDKTKFLEKKYLNILKFKDKQIEKLKNQINSKKKSIVECVKIFEKPNEFPKLMMKKQYADED